MYLSCLLCSPSFTTAFATATITTTISSPFQFSRSGKPSVTLLTLSSDESIVAWEAHGLGRAFNFKTAGGRSVPISGVQSVTIGRESAAFHRAPERSRGSAHLSLSLVLKASHAIEGRETLDLCCSDEETFGLLVAAFRALLDELRLAKDAATRPWGGGHVFIPAAASAESNAPASAIAASAHDGEVTVAASTQARCVESAATSSTAAVASAVGSDGAAAREEAERAAKRIAELERRIEELQAGATTVAATAADETSSRGEAEDVEVVLLPADAEDADVASSAADEEEVPPRISSSTYLVLSAYDGDDCDHADDASSLADLGGAFSTAAEAAAAAPAAATPGFGSDDGAECATGLADSLFRAISLEEIKERQQLASAEAVAGALFASFDAEEDGEAHAAQEGVCNPFVLALSAPTKEDPNSSTATAAAAALFEESISGESDDLELSDDEGAPSQPAHNPFDDEAPGAALRSANPFDDASVLVDPHFKRAGRMASEAAELAERLMREVKVSEDV